MPPTPPNILQAFHENNCMELTCWLEHVHMGRATVSKLRDCFGGKRQNLPFRFARTYGGDRREKIGVFSELERSKKDVLTLFIRWFRVSAEPPERYGSYSAFVNCVTQTVRNKEAFVTARFSYNLERTASIFSPIQIGPEAGIFDEIVGFSGIKRNAKGKLLYKLEVTLGAKQLEHKVTFFQTIGLSEELPLVLLDIATRVSNLGLKRGESK